MTAVTCTQRGRKGSGETACIGGMSGTRFNLTEDLDGACSDGTFVSDLSRWCVQVDGVLADTNRPRN